jgi:hypothetical protein
VVDDLVDEANGARAAALLAGPSMEGRVVRGRFVAAMVVGRAAVVFPGDDLAAAVDVNVVLRAVGLLFSSPEVTDDRSGSASEAAADREARPVLLAAVPGAGRVGGLFKLDPAVVVREVALESGLDAVVEALAVRDEAAGRRAGAEVPLVTVGRRGGTESLEVEEALEAILRRAGDAGAVVVVDDVDARAVLCGLGASGAVVTSAAGASPAGASLGRGASSAMVGLQLKGRRRKLCCDRDNYARGIRWSLRGAGWRRRGRDREIGRSKAQPGQQSSQLLQCDALDACMNVGWMTPDSRP